MTNIYTIRKANEKRVIARGTQDQVKDAIVAGVWYSISVVGVV